MSYTERFSELHNPLLVEYPDQYPPGNYVSNWVDVGLYHRLVLLFKIGDMQAGAEFECGLLSSTDALGTAAWWEKWTQNYEQVDGDNDMLFCVELRTEELDVDGGRHFVAVVFDIDNAPIEIDYILFGIEPRFAPVPTTNYDEIV